MKWSQPMFYTGRFGKCAICGKTGLVVVLSKRDLGMVNLSYGGYVHVDPSECICNMRKEHTPSVEEKPRSTSSSACRR